MYIYVHFEIHIKGVGIPLGFEVTTSPMYTHIPAVSNCRISSDPT